jgi:hypothetical protein
MQHPVMAMYVNKLVPQMGAWGEDFEDIEDQGGSRERSLILWPSRIRHVIVLN